MGYRYMAMTLHILTKNARRSVAGSVAGLRMNALDLGYQIKTIQATVWVFHLTAE